MGPFDPFCPPNCACRSLFRAFPRLSPISGVPPSESLSSPCPARVPRGRHQLMTKLIFTIIVAFSFSLCFSDLKPFLFSLSPEPVVGYPISLSLHPLDDFTPRQLLGEPTSRAPSFSSSLDFSHSISWDALLAFSSHSLYLIGTISTSRRMAAVFSIH